MYQTLIQTFQSDWVYSSTQSSLALQNSCCVYYPVFCHPSCTIVMSQLSSLTIIYFILVVKSCSSTFLVAMSANYRPPSHQSFLCIFQFSPFLAKLFLLAICHVCFLYLPFLAMHIVRRMHFVRNGEKCKMQKNRLAWRRSAVGRHWY